MDPVELESLLQGGTETPSFEVKAAMPWDARKLAKDILAMSNLPDGGSIVIGVEDLTFLRQGVDEAIRATYNVDVMRDQMAEWADPHVEFSVSAPTDAQGKQYVAIRVRTFRQIPVICRKDGSDMNRGALYYRATNRRVRSAQIDNSNDMRDLITTAAARMREGLRALGVQITSPSDAFRESLNEELGDL